MSPRTTPCSAFRSARRLAELANDPLLRALRLGDTDGGGGGGGPEESIRSMLGRKNLGVGRRGGDPSGDVLGGERVPPVSDRGGRPSSREARGRRHR